MLRFLRGRFFHVENAYKLVKKHFYLLKKKNSLYISDKFTHFLQLCHYYEFRDNNPELHVDVHPLHLKRIGEDDIVSVMPYRDQVGRRIMVYKIGNWRPSKVPINDIFKASLILFEMGAMEPPTQVLGGIGIFDLEGLSLNHGWYVTPSVAKKMISLMVVSNNK